MKKILVVLFLLGLTHPFYAQDPVMLDEVLITSMNYKYLSAVDNKAAPIPVKMLEREAAKFSAEGRELYVDKFNTYSVSFYIPDGKIVALYDDEGNILKTIERFKNVQLPEDVRMAVTERFPNWEIVKDVYQVNYNKRDGATKVYKMKLKNGAESIRIMMDAKGNYL